MTQLDSYQRLFRYLRLHRESDVLEMTIHRDGGPAVWDFGPTGMHSELIEALRAIRHDTDNRVLILTGSGDVFLKDIGAGDTTADELSAMRTVPFWDRIYREGNALIQSLLDIEIPIIAAVNGDAFIHAELAVLSDAVLSDIVLAAEHARFADEFHFCRGGTGGWWSRRLANAARPESRALLSDDRAGDSRRGGETTGHSRGASAGPRVNGPRAGFRP